MAECGRLRFGPRIGDSVKNLEKRWGILLETFDSLGGGAGIRSNERASGATCMDMKCRPRVAITCQGMLGS